MRSTTLEYVIVTVFALLLFAGFTQRYWSSMINPKVQLTNALDEAQRGAK